VQWDKPPTPDKLGRDWDYRLNYLGEGIKLEPVTDPQGGPVHGPYWKLVEAKWWDDQEAGGASQVFVKALDAQGNPLENVAFVVIRPDAQDSVRTKGSIDGFWGNYTMYGLLGTYIVEMTEGSHPSERVTGVGLGTEEVPDAWINTAFRFTFQLTEADAGRVEVPTDVGEATPGGEEIPVPTGEEALHRALHKAARAHLAARSPRGKFYRYARKHDLGRRRSQDFSFEHKGTKYTAQVFQRGIIYAPVGQWDQVTHAERED
jgi:hypothetical protein